MSPLKQMPQYKSVDYKPLEIPQAGIGGLNLKDLEFEQQLNQSPYMLNMMYRNGTFSKRYGQKIYLTYDDEIYAIETFYDDVFVHSGKKMYKNGEVVSGDIELPEQIGVFAKFYQSLYYLVDKHFYVYGRDKDNYSEFKFSVVEPYTPTVFNGAEPQKEAKTAEEGESGFGGYPQDEFNLLSLKAEQLYNGNGTDTEYYIKGGVNDSYDWTIRPEIKIDDVEVTDFTLDEENGKVVFTTAPAEGYDNVSMTWTLKESAIAQDRNRLLSSKYSISFGNANNTRLFLCGGGSSKYFFSAPYDATYFPESNWEIVGRTEDDLTGFGLQYNTLFIFKPTEIYSVGNYTHTSTDEVTGQAKTSSYFMSQLVNAEKGCDAPHTIQLIDNKLTWFSTRYGICTLVSSNILDERNVRIISRNIEYSNSFGVKGLLDYHEDLETIQSVDFDNKYFLCFPESGMCFVWDYQISPYYYTNSKETDVKVLDYFLFDNFHVRQFLNIRGIKGSGVDLIYIRNNEPTQIAILNDTFADDLYGEDEEGKTLAKPIFAYYMTPFMQFGAVEYLKNVRDIFVQVRGDTSSVIDMWYYTEQSSEPEREPESIRIGGRIWEHFTWNNFQWLMVNHAKAFRRRCSLKKIEMCAFYFENGELGRDLSISHISIFYQIVKAVR